MTLLKVRHLVFNVFNLPKHIMSIIAGPDHPLYCRLIAGSVVMLLSTGIHESLFVLAALRELVHAIGAIPWIEFASAWPLANAPSGLTGLEPSLSSNAGLRPHGLEIVRTDTATLNLVSGQEQATDFR